MRIEPSPSTSMTSLPGLASCAPMAAGSPKPMVPMLPEVRKVRAFTKSRYCAAHIWCWPTPVVTIAWPRVTWFSCSRTYSGWIDVDVRDLRARRKLLHLAGDPVVEARAHGEEEVAVLDRVVGVRRAVHTEHVERELAGRVHGADAHERGHHRDAEALGEGAQLGRRVAVVDPAADVHERPLGGGEQLEEGLRVVRRDGRLPEPP